MTGSDEMEEGAVLMLDELEEDALKEFFNMGLGMAADSLSQMVDNEVLLSLPQLAMVSYQDAVGMLPHKPGEKLVAIRQNFHGELTGTSLLLFPGAESLELVRTLLGEKMPLTALTELEQETLLDVGNVILNAFLVSFTQMMSLDFEFEPAEFLKGDSQFLLNISSHLIARSQEMSNGNSNDQAFILMMDFKTSDEDEQEHTLNGFVILLFSTKAMITLKKELKQIISQL